VWSARRPVRDSQRDLRNGPGDQLDLGGYTFQFCGKYGTVRLQFGVGQGVVNAKGWSQITVPASGRKRLYTVTESVDDDAAHLPLHP